MIRPQLRSVCIRVRWTEIEAVTVDRLLAGLTLRFHPVPGGECDELITCEILRGAKRLLVRASRIQSQEFSSLVPKILHSVCLHAVRGGLLRGEHNVETAFVVVPPSQHRDVVLLTRSENGRDGFRQEVAVDVRTERVSLRPRLAKNLKQFFRRHSTQFG